MGLDMYLNGYDRVLSAMGKDDNEELGYWRKHPNLHGYIVQTFAGGVDECQMIPLTRANLLDIINAVKAKRLPHTTGFFFGTSNDSNDVQTIEILMKALKWLDADPKAANRREIYYQASW